MSGPMVIAVLLWIAACVAACFTPLPVVEWLVMWSLWILVYQIARDTRKLVDRSGP